MLDETQRELLRRMSPLVRALLVRNKDEEDNHEVGPDTKVQLFNLRRMFDGGKLPHDLELTTKNRSKSYREKIASLEIEIENIQQQLSKKSRKQTKKAPLQTTEVKPQYKGSMTKITTDVVANKSATVEDISTFLKQMSEEDVKIATNAWWETCKGRAIKSTLNAQHKEFIQLLDQIHRTYEIRDLGRKAIQDKINKWWPYAGRVCIQNAGGGRISWSTLKG